MASLCSKCLAELRSGSQTCSQCGTEQVAKSGMGTGATRGVRPGTSNGVSNGNGTRNGLDPGFDPLALKFEPPPFERKIDPKSPQSLLGPSAHLSPGIATNASAPSASAPSADTAALGAGIAGPSLPWRSDPVRGSAPTPQDLLFGSLQPTYEGQLAAHSPVSAATGVLTSDPHVGDTQVGETQPLVTRTEVSPFGVSDRRPVRNGPFKKLFKPKVLIPVAVILVAGAMVASVMATTHTTTRTPKTATPKTSAGGKSGARVSTRALSHRSATAKTMTVALRSPGDDPDLTSRSASETMRRSTSYWTPAPLGFASSRIWCPQVSAKVFT